MVGILALVAFVLSFGAGYHVGSHRPVEVVRDTSEVLVLRWKDLPKPANTALDGFVPVPSYKFISDTVDRIKTVELAIHDTTVVYLPREEKYYEENDGRLRLWVSGYEPRLDRWELDEKVATIKETVQEPRKRWGFGVTAGYGASIGADRSVTLSPFVGVGISYNFVNW